MRIVRTPMWYMVGFDDYNWLVISTVWNRHHKLRQKWALSKPLESQGTSALIFLFMQDGYQSQSLDDLFTIMSQAVDRSTIQFWTALSKGHSA